MLESEAISNEELGLEEEMKQWIISMQNKTEMTNNLIAVMKRGSMNNRKEG